MGDTLNGALNNQKQVLDSLDPTCNEFKHAYDACFTSWFAETYLKGGHMGPSPCDELLNAYTVCVKKAVESRNIGLEMVDTEKRNLEYFKKAKADSEGSA